MAARARLPLICRNFNTFRPWSAQHAVHNLTNGCTDATYSKPVSKNGWSDHLVLGDLGLHLVIVGLQSKVRSSAHTSLWYSLITGLISPPGRTGPGC